MNAWLSAVIQTQMAIKKIIEGRSGEKYLDSDESERSV